MDDNALLFAQKAALVSEVTGTRNAMRIVKEQGQHTRALVSTIDLEWSPLCQQFDLSGLY